MEKYTMWTEEAKISELIFTRITDPTAQTLVYQAFFHIETFKHSMKELHEVKETLNFHNFARSQSCHMTEGIFGADIHTAKMESAEIKTYGFLGITVSSGHKFFRSLMSARKKDRGTDWKCFREDFKSMPETYRRARNAMEHLYEAIYDGRAVSNDDLAFSIHDILRFRDDDGECTLNFSKTELEKIVGIWERLVLMLEARPKPVPFSVFSEE